MIDAERAASDETEEVDTEMAKILPLLQQYLSGMPIFLFTFVAYNCRSS